MHIILGILSLVLYFIWISDGLRRHGIRLSSFNPFSAIHRMRWRAKSGVNPLYCLEDPRDVVTVLLISLVKSTGEMTREQKECMLRTLRKQFQLSAEEAEHHIAQASFLMRDTVDILQDVTKIAAPLAGCTPAQVASVEAMLSAVATEEGSRAPNTYQQALITKVMTWMEQDNRPKL